MRLVMFLLLIVQSSFFAQESKPIHNLKQLEDYFGFMEINRIKADSIDNIWIATRQGIYKYTGAEIVYFDLSKIFNYKRINHVRSISIPNRNTVLLSTFEGVVEYSEATNTFQLHSVDSIHNQLASHNTVFDMVKIDKNKLLVGTAYGLLIHNINTKKSWVLWEDDAVLKVEYDKKNHNVLAFTETNKLVVLSVDSLNKQKIHALDHPLKDMAITFIDMEVNGLFFTSKTSFGKLSLEPNYPIEVQVKFNKDALFPTNSRNFSVSFNILSVSNVDKFGFRNILTNNYFQYRFGQVDGVYKTEVKEVKEIDKSIYFRSYWGPDNILWYASQKNGVKIVNYEDQLLEKINVTPINYVVNSTAFKSESEFFLFSGPSRISRVNTRKNAYSEITIDAKNVNLNVFYKTANTNLSLDKKQLYANTLGSFYLIDLESNKIQYNVNNKAIRTLEENLNSAITDISVLNNSNVIISTLASLSEYNSAFKLIRSTDISLTNDTIALSNESIMSIFELDGQSVLLKSLHQKLYYWNTQTNTVIETSLHEPVSNVIIHDSLIWIATSKSISSYKWVDGDLEKQLDMINENDIKDFVFDKNGNIWYTNGTYLKGVSKTGSVIYSFLNFAVKLDGLISNIVCVDLDGKLIVSSDKKLVALDISNYSFLTSLNKEIKISAIYELEGNKKVNISRLNKNPIQLPYAQNFIEIQFSPTDYNFLDNLYYEYRLDSESSSWLKTTDNRVVLNFLKSGSYNFEVRGVFPDGTVSKAQMLPFTVLAPFWQTPWFRVFIILLIISILGLVVFVRENKRRAVLQIQNKLAANIHDDLGTSLAKVSIYAELLSQNKDLSHYDKLKKMIKEIKQSVSDSSWVIDSNEATLNDLIQRIRLMHRESCQAVESECVQLIEITNGKMRLNSSDKENLYLLLKELITNCIKYTQSMEMLLEIVQTKNKIEIRLKNEYSYIKERSTDMGGKGKANIQLRIKQLKGQVFSMDDNFFHMEVRL